MAIGAVISLFTGAMGLDLGFERAGFEIRVAVECNKWAARTIRKNRPNTAVIERNIEDVSTEEILEAAKLKVGECLVVTGGPSCQGFSTAGRRGSLSDPRGTLFHHFLRVINEARPRFFVMENVQGILSAAIRHRPLKERGPGHPPLRPEEELGAAFRTMLQAFENTGYYVIFGLLNAADYGTPQTRRRVLFLGSRDGEPIKMPVPTHDCEGAQGMPKWVTLREALSGLVNPEPEYKPLSPVQMKFLKQIPPGGNWRDLPESLQEDALGGAFHSWGGRNGFSRRLSWDKPAPALTTSPNGKATMLCHMESLRPLSIKECARIQQFPDNWEFEGGLTQRYIQIGNAVPVGLGQATALALVDTMQPGAKKLPEMLGKACCANADLAERLARRPRTILNPLHMRPGDSKEATREWLCSISRHRIESLPIAPAPS